MMVINWNIYSLSLSYLRRAIQKSFLIYKIVQVVNDWLVALVLSQWIEKDTDQLVMLRFKPDFSLPV